MIFHDRNQGLSTGAYYGRKSGGGSPYNYCLAPLIDDFSFTQFILEGRNPDLNEHGGFLIMTDKQYIIGYNAGFGSGTHNSSFARATKDMHGGGEINNFSECSRLFTFCQNRYFTGRIIYEKNINDENERPTYSGYLNIEFGDVPVTPEKLASFEKFYLDYNDEIRRMCKKYNFSVSFSYIDNGMIKSFSDLDSLNPLLEYLKGAVSEDARKTSSEKEIIIGVSNDYQKNNVSSY